MIGKKFTVDGKGYIIQKLCVEVDTFDIKELGCCDIATVML